VAAEHTASWYQNDKLMQYQIGKKGPYKNLGLTARFVLCLSVAVAFFSFLSSLRSVHVHQRSCMISNTN
jgi:hypothetical protein